MPAMSEIFADRATVQNIVYAVELGLDFWAVKRPRDDYTWTAVQKDMKEV